MIIYAENRKARFTYEVLETFHAGLELNGQEVKSIKSGRIQIAGSYIILRGGELFLIGAVIPPYQPANAPNDYQQDRIRKLLLHKKEIRALIGKIKEKGLTFVPLKVYNHNRRIKLEFGIARGKKKYDKREVLKQRQDKREIERALKRGKAT
ncbi:MAG: SsrA-binding protein [Candidatus Wildermuthbacteria bacterium RIFCSPHIGHO2_12_FULL_45_9]|uniref:SsrA-binding protein n=1 Tax=Candidatus Wildermuthbacteria bacterium RIFCSPHIGHO2_02_FULL_45_25 TaxID=1802450 RepID=A0A1G2R1H3_9BACT|nr:MAG: SsrA-binding protein [Candidatus Wildermuthbacteria bacterium RIFCSPHIGHO2_01_FULL_45_20]OHA66680.1 MAG: SsrA-binding protein [Candidatus Wildermuthbacteria bacterium RIFCSPHIGHO2_02_FULL_45_25]OHA70290.1 MAG: SsrA-binding protein [Candidatus Wildermuthbacteria bacterium RIFCSPHIGHO2_12_FULL_45_9]